MCRTTLVDEVIDPKKRPGKVKKGDVKSSTLLKPSLHQQPLGKPLPTCASPPTILNGSSSESSAASALSEPTKQAQRFSLLHILATGPISPQTASGRSHIPLPDVIKTFDIIAQQIEGGPNWQLLPRRFRELDIWRFPYPSTQDRDAAIDNAVHAFDKLRLSTSDPLWQNLLPKEERNKGKTLSKLSVSTPNHRQLLGGKLNGQPRSNQNSPNPAKADNMARRLVNRQGRPVRPRANEASKPKNDAKSTKKPLSDAYVHESDDDDIARDAEPPKDGKTPKAPLKAAPENKKGVKRRVAVDANGPEVEGSGGNKRPTEPAKKRVKTNGEMSLQKEPSVVPKTTPKHSTDHKNNPPAKASVSPSNENHKPHGSARTVIGAKQGNRDSVNLTKTPFNLNSPKQAASTSSTSTPTPVDTSATSSTNINSKQASSSAPPPDSSREFDNVATKKRISPVTGKPERIRALKGRESNQFFEYFKSKKATPSSQPSGPKTASSTNNGAKRPTENQRAGDGETTQPQAKKVKTRMGSQGSSSPLSSVPSKISTPPDQTQKPGSGRSSQVRTKLEAMAQTSNSDNKSRSKEHSSMNEQKMPPSQPPREADHSSKTGERRAPENVRLESSPEIHKGPISDDAFDRCPQLASHSEQNASAPELRKMRQDAIAEYIKERIEFDKAEDKTKERIKAIYGKLERLQGLMQEEVPGQGTAEISAADLITSSLDFPDGAADFFRRKLEFLLPRYNGLWPAYQSHHGPEPYPEKAELASLHKEVGDLKLLYQAASKREYLQRDEKLASNPPGDTTPSTPPSRRQTLHLYSEYHEKFHAYQAFKMETRNRPDYPFIPPDRLKQDQEMFLRLCQRRKELFSGFDEIVRGFSRKLVGEVTMDEEHPVPTFNQIETLTWKVRAKLLEWKYKHDQAFGTFGEASPEEMTALWDELKVIKEDQKQIIRAYALQFGAIEKARHEDVEVESLKVNIRM